MRGFDRDTGLVLAVAAVLVGCTDPPNDAASNGSGGRSAALASMDACSSAQVAVADALSTPDLGVARSSIANARKACSSAADMLRQNPIPKLDTEGAAKAVDDMVGGLGQIESAIDMLQSTPRAAKRKAQAGMRQYQRGVEALKAVTARG